MPAPSMIAPFFPSPEYYSLSACATVYRGRLFANQDYVPVLGYLGGGCLRVMGVGEIRIAELFFFAVLKSRL